MGKELSKLFKDMTGQRSGKLTVLNLESKTKWGVAVWKCQCDCGAIVIRHSAALRKNNVSSCLNCRTIKKGSQKKIYPREYLAYHNMKRRCYETTGDRWQYYGGRGVTVCDRWMKSFRAFIEDMGPKSDPNLSIDRIDVNGNYEPSNCRWATLIEQSRNKRVRNKNKFGVSGVGFDARRNKFTAKIGARKLINLGHFDNLFDAICARKSAENKYWRAE